MKTLLIKQPAGLGDVFYCQKIGKVFAEAGWKVYWPVISQYTWLEKYLRGPIKYVDAPCRPDKILDLQNAYHILGKTKPEEMLPAKYELAEIGSWNWAQYFEFEKPVDQEPVPEGEYALINLGFASPPNEEKAAVDCMTRMPKIFIEHRPTVFHWCDAIMNAAELHFVDTCFTYLAEKLPIKAKRMVLYPRKPYHDHVITKVIWKRPWEYRE